MQLDISEYNEDFLLGTYHTSFQAKFDFYRLFSEKIFLVGLLETKPNFFLPVFIQSE
jgi:hypothetical protein